MISPMPIFISSFATEMPAAPAPLMTHFTVSQRLPTTFSALIIAAVVTTAVPCWSSWKIGISHSSWSRVLDLKAARRGDVLQVDTAEASRQQIDRTYDLVHVVGS